MIAQIKYSNGFIFVKFDQNKYGEPEMEYTGNDVALLHDQFTSTDESSSVPT